MSDNQLVLYYPCKGEGAPEVLSRQLVKYVAKYKHAIRYDVNIFPECTEFEMPSEVKESCTIINLKKIKAMVKEHKNVLVHVPMAFLIAPNKRTVLALYAYFKCPGRLITNCHGPVRITTMSKLANREVGSFLQLLPSYLFYPSLLKLSGIRIVHSPYMKNLLRQKYGLSTHLIPNAIENWWIESNDNNIEGLDGDPAFFYHGRLVHEKGLDLLVAAFAKLKHNYKKAKLYIAGSGPLYNVIANFSTRRGLKDSIILLGNLGSRTLRTYLKTVDAAVYPSRFDSFSLSALEALASAGGIVALSKNVGLTGLFRGEFKKIPTFEPSRDQIYELLVALSEKIFSKDIIKLQKGFASQFTWDKIVHMYIKLYNDLEQS